MLASLTAKYPHNSSNIPNITLQQHCVGRTDNALWLVNGNFTWKTEKLNQTEVSIKSYICVLSLDSWKWVAMIYTRKGCRVDLAHSEQEGGGTGRG